MAKLELDQGVKYAKHLFRHASGFDYAQHLYRSLEPEKTNNVATAKMLAGIADLYSFALPVTFRAAHQSASSEKSPFLGYAITVGGVAVDIGTYMLLLQISHSFGEFMFYKSIANLGTHAMVDAIRFGIDKAKTFRPSATTLAV